MIPGDLDDPANDYSHGVFGLQISPGARHRRRGSRAREAHQRHPALLRRAHSARRSDHSVRGSRTRTRASRRDVVPASDRARRDVGHVAHVARRHRDRGGNAEPRHPAGVVAGGEHRERPALGASGGNLRRRSPALLPDGRVVRERVRACRRRRDAQALRRQLRRRWARQLSDRLRRAAARRDVLPAISRGDSRGTRAFGDERVQLGRRVAGDAESLAAHGQAAPGLGLSRIRHLGRRGHGRRDGAAPHRGEHRDRDDGRARGGARRDLSELVAAASAVPRRVQARAHPGFRDRLRGRACAAREVRARTVRASVRGRRQREAGERQRRTTARSPSRRRTSRSSCSRTTAARFRWRRRFARSP